MEKAAKKKKKIQWSKYIPVYIMALPGFIYLIINNYLPMFGVTIAFKDLDFKKGLLASPWAGFKNFEYLFRSKDALLITRNTVLYNVLFIFLGMFIGVTLAICLNELRSKLVMRTYQSAILIPYLMSWVIASYLVYALLAPDVGLLNKTILPALGMKPVNWYTTTGPWPLILTLANIWKSSGFGMVIYYSSIIGISTELYEAAEIDGASKWQQIKSITLPLLKPTIITLTILNLGRIFSSDFGLFYQVPKNSGILYPVTRTLDVYVYNALMNNNDFAMSSAASVYQAVVGFIFIMTANGIIRKVSSEDALF
ncbi:MAG: sugar ABC transporter permease [Acutalibacter sp.]|nr:sugar ABC transporter permease [Acutalibacter sp.]